MSHNSTLNRIQRSTAIVAMLLALSSLARAADPRTETATPSSEADSTQQQATPAHPPAEAEPLDADDTVLV